jgi:hypothetical protein
MQLSKGRAMSYDLLHSASANLVESASIEIIYQIGESEFINTGQIR